MKTAFIKVLQKNNPLVKKGWIWNPEKLEVIRDFVWHCPETIEGTWTSKDNILTITDNKWLIKKDYTYNNCSMVPSGQTDNTPNLPVKSLTKQSVKILWKAAMIHDKGYEGLRDDTDFPFSRRQMDHFFYYETRRTPFKYPRLYWLGIRLFGGFSLMF